MDETRSQPNHSFMQANWHHARPSDRGANTALEALNLMFAAEAWCQETLPPDAAFRYGYNFYFEREEDMILFRLTWG